MNTGLQRYEVHTVRQWLIVIVLITLWMIVVECINECVHEVRLLTAIPSLSVCRTARTVRQSRPRGIVFGIVWKGVSPKSGSDSEVCLEKTDWNCLFRRLALARGFSIVSPRCLSGATPVVSLRIAFIIVQSLLLPMSIIGSIIYSKYFWYCCLIFLCAF